MRNSKLNRSNSGGPRCSSGLIPVIAAVSALAWCLFILLHSYQSASRGGLAAEPTSTIAVKDVPSNILKERATALRGVPDANNAAGLRPEVSGGAHSEEESGSMHVAFSTDCTFYQDWQSLLMFHSAITVGQQGTLTRIASGCSEAKKVELLALYLKLFPMYHVHFTPDYKKDGKTDKGYDFYNKPFGVEHWLDNAVPRVEAHTVIAIVDPDMVFLRPLTATIQEDNMMPLHGEKTFPKFIKRGVPVGQKYGLGAPWATGRTTPNFDRAAVCGLNSTGCMGTTEAFGDRHYSVGPPYILERDDLYRLTKTWCAFVPRVYQRYPELLAEMYAYSMAAAHENLPHLSVMHYMVSNTGVSDEGWKWIDVLGTDVCQPPVEIPRTGEHFNTTGITQHRFYPNQPMPNLLHYCQFFRAGHVGFQKRRVKERILECDFPLLLEPPLTLGTVDFKERDGEILKVTPEWAKRNAFALNVIHRSINSMLVYYKQNMCPGGQFSMEKTLNAVQWPVKPKGS